MKRISSTYRHFLTLVALLFTSISYAQVGVTGINVQEPKALLHVEPLDNVNPETGAGILIPSVTQFSLVNPGAAQYGMLVFRSEATGSGFEGFYYWDNPNTTWEYIVTEKITELDLNKSSAYGTAFETNIVSGNTNYVKVPFEVVESPKASYFIDANGDLNIGQTGEYYISFTGGVNKPNTGENIAEGITTAVFLNGTINANLVSNTVFPAVLNNSRSVTFAISSSVTLQAGDKISLRTRRVSATQLGTLTVNSPFTLIVSYLD
ncbi:hypothetical protein ACFSKL_22230 [Belliella marina]|uniref:C1q domain-containing protein n=1 Tax=Belliella marina TaxID=1644146 RepID=A0ABW4VW18_9BACT